MLFIFRGIAAPPPSFWRGVPPPSQPSIAWGLTPLPLVHRPPCALTTWCSDCIFLVKGWSVDKEGVRRVYLPRTVIREALLGSWSNGTYVAGGVGRDRALLLVEYVIFPFKKSLLHQDFFFNFTTYGPSLTLFFCHQWKKIVLPPSP